MDDVSLVVNKDSTSQDSNFSIPSLRLDNLVTYHYDQIQRNADILKDDLETIRKRCMVPDLPKLVNNNAESEILAKSILNQFDAVVHKYIEVMSSLSTALKAQMYERFPTASPPNMAAPDSDILAVSPPSATHEADVQMEDLGSTHITSVAELPDLNDVEPEAFQNCTVATAGDVMQGELAAVSTEMQLGSDCGTNNHSDNSAESNAMVLVPAAHTSKPLVRLRRRGRNFIAFNSEEMSSDSAANLVVAQPIAIDGLCLDEDSTPADKTDSEKEDEDIPTLLKCPKLSQITKVVLHRVSDTQKLFADTQREEKTDSYNVRDGIDDLERELDKTCSSKPMSKGKKSARTNLPRIAKSKVAKGEDKEAEESDVNMIDTDTGDDSSYSDEELDLYIQPQKDAGNFPLCCDDDDLGNGGSGSDLLDLDLTSGSELESKKEKKKVEPQKKTEKKSKKQYSKLNKVSLGLTSSESDDDKKNKEEKKGADSEAKTIKTEPKGSDDDPKSIESNPTKYGDESDSDLEFLFKCKRTVSSTKRKRTLRSDSEENSEVLQSTGKKLISESLLSQKIREICGPDSGNEAASKIADSKNGKNNSDTDGSTKKPKKRRRIKNKEKASESSDSDIVILDSKEGSAGTSAVKSPNRAIRKVMAKSKLEKTTRQAGKEEEDRKRRIAENQKLYNQYFDTEVEKGEALKELVLDFDRNTKQPLISVDPAIVKTLKPHQVKGIKFMWDNCYESIESVKKNGGGGGGCILAHCMGLGKTLQTIGFLHTVISTEACKTNRALVICPLNTVGNWLREFQDWCVDCDVRPRIHSLWDSKGKKRFEALFDWERLGGVGILNYEAFRVLTSLDEKKKGRPTPRELKIVKSSLCDPGPDVVVCDEGHLLKNASTKQAQSVMKLRTSRRVVLTGTPLQNDLMEYHTMMSFVKPNLLGTKKEFRNRFVNPIEKGQHKGSTDAEVLFMKRRAHVLHKLLDGCVQRLDYSVLTPYLPPKHEYAISINLSQIQKDLYTYYLDNISAKSNGIALSRRLLVDYQSLVKVWTHPIILTKSRNRSGSSGSEADSMKDFICDDDASSENESEKSPPPPQNPVDSDLEIINETTGKEQATKQVEEGGKTVAPKNWYLSVLQSQDPNELDKLELSGKLTILVEILKTCAQIGDRVLVFSQFLSSLDLIEKFLAEMDHGFLNKEGKESLERGRWRPDVEYFRIDGSVNSNQRQKSCNTFNEDRASRAKLFLISTKAGSLGINLPGANRVVIFDASWNPSHDIQSIFRVYRFGQTKPCYVYRLLARGTMEEKIYNRQVVKLSLSCRVVDEQQIERHFQYDEVQAMYDFNANDTTERPVPAVPKDRLLADLLISHKDWIFSYLEHDSLLENKEEEELTEAERRAAWDEYKNEDVPKTLPLPSDPWSLSVIAALRQRYPAKSYEEILDLTHRTRLQFFEMQNYIGIASSPLYDEVTKKACNTKLTSIAASLKLVFGDDINWTQWFANRPGQPKKS